MDLLIQNCMLDGVRNSIGITGNRITTISPDLKPVAADVIDASGKAVIPGLLNGHTHAAMTLFRGYGDDMALHDWLNNKIWPIEAKITEDDVYWGTKLACLEMIKSGTTFFNDMYWQWDGVARAVDEMGLRASLAGVIIDLFDPVKAKEQMTQNAFLFDRSKSYSDRIHFCLGPHAIYTVSAESLRWVKDFADANDLLIHTHLSESEKEVRDCLDQHGMRPVDYLESIGFLGPKLSIAHAIWLDDAEIAKLKEHGVGVLTNPCANMKLATGRFPYSRVRAGGVRIGIGTDGPGSNNNLDMFEDMKFLALAEKVNTGDPTAAPAQEVFDCATTNTAEIFNIDAGRIDVGALADIVLIDLQQVVFSPGHNLVSDLVYAANGSVVDTVICDGKVLMQDRVVDGEDEIIARGREVAQDLMSR